MYFTEETKNSLTVLIKIKQEVHIIKNLKIKLFIEIDILSLKLINIYILKKEIYLETYKVTVSIKIHLHKIPI